MKQQHFVIDFLNTLAGTIDRTREAAQPVNVYYRNNADGSLRWVWPASMKQPLFLRFYNTPSMRAVCIKLFIQLIFFCRLQRFFKSGSVSVILERKDISAFDLSRNDWALFAGTPGVHQTVIIYQDRQFHKIPVGSDAKTAIKKEFQSLDRWKYFSFAHFDVPSARLEKDILTLSDIKIKGQQPGVLTDQHWKVLRELSRTWSSTISIKLLPQWKNMQARLAHLKEQPSDRLPLNLISKLELLSRYVNTSQIIPASVSHGDFTPWNMFVNANRIGVIDWELSEATAPLLTDAFHFLYQQTSLVERKGFRHLSRRISESFGNLTAEQIIRGNEVDVRLHHRLYLLFTASKYLAEYAVQKQWHPQVAWSIRMWNEAVNAELLRLGVYNQRQLLLQDVFDFLQAKEYAVLKWKGGHPAGVSTESDLDICMKKDTATTLYSFLRSHPFVKKVNRSRRSFMNNLAVILEDGSFLSIDTIWEFKRKALVMMDAEEVLATSAVQAFGVKAPAAHQDFTYTWLFYLLNGKGLPEKYQVQFSFFSKPLRKEMEEKVNWKNILGVRSYKELFAYNGDYAKKVVAKLNELPVNKGWSKWKNRFWYCIDTIREHRPRKGFMITFSGVDGAGKSTVIENIKTQVEKRYRRKVAVLRHRPAILPMLSAWKEGRSRAEQMAAERLPRQGKNSSTLSSLIRFAYYYCDYLLGQFVVYLKYVSRGYVVIYDRYYFDFINDGKRSNITLPPAFTRIFYSLLIKPRYNFFLYADADTILKRKRELDRETIHVLTNQYLKLFTRLADRYSYSRYVPVENKRLDETLETIHAHIKPAAI